MVSTYVRVNVLPRKFELAGAKFKSNFENLLPSNGPAADHTLAGGE